MSGKFYEQNTRLQCRLISIKEQQQTLLFYNFQLLKCYENPNPLTGTCGLCWTFTLSILVEKSSKDVPWWAAPN